MRKLFFAIAVAAASFMPSLAQDVFDAGSDNRPYLGLRVGFESPVPCSTKYSVGSTTLSQKNFKSGAGFDLGAVYNIPLWKNLYFEPGVSIFYNAMGVKDDALKDIVNIQGLDVKASVRTFGFRIPFVVGYRFDLSACSLYAYTGPELEVGLVGRAHATAKYQGEKASESESIYSDGYRRFDIGWKLGVGLSVDKYYVGLSGNLGMINRLSDSNGVSYRQNLFQLSLGYNF